MPDDATLWIVADTAEPDAPAPEDGRRSGVDVGGGYGNPHVFEPRTRRQRVPLDAKAVKAQMQGLIAIVNDLFDQAEGQTDLQLNEVELSAEINAEGQVSIVGNGGKLGNKGGITLKFVRRS